MEPNVKVIVLITPKNYDRLWTASAATGDSFTDTINRALNLYDLIVGAPKRARISFSLDSHGTTVRQLRIIK